MGYGLVCLVMFECFVWVWVVRADCAWGAFVCCFLGVCLGWFCGWLVGVCLFLICFVGCLFVGLLLVLLLALMDVC